MKRLALLLAALVAVILVGGCVGQGGQPSTTTGGDGTTTGGGDGDLLGTDTGGEEGGTEPCTSPYEGTWKGVISDGGDLEVVTYGSNDEELSRTLNPFIAQYDFEMTIKCDYEMLDDNGANDGWNFEITYVKASHPIFDCANGCEPTDTAVKPSYVFIHKDGSGGIAVDYPNGASFIAIGMQTNGDLQAAPDAKTMDLRIYGSEFTSIGSIYKLYKDQSVQYVETYNCRQVAGPDTICNRHMILPGTIKLTKIS